MGFVMAASSLHELDFYAWTPQHLFRSGKLTDVDFEHVEVAKYGRKIIRD